MDYAESQLSKIPTEFEFKSRYDSETSTAWFKCYENEFSVKDINQQEYEGLKSFIVLTAKCFRVDGWNAAIRTIRANNEKRSKTYSSRRKSDDRNPILEGLGFYLFDDI